MMLINLLPWRERDRAERRRQFLIALGGCATIAALVLLPIYLTIESMVRSQLSLNQYMKGEIKKLDSQLTEIQNLQQQRQQLLARMMIIQTLQEDRAQIVQIFDDFATKIPTGVYFNSIDKLGTKYLLLGSADSNASVSLLMRNLEKSEWFINPSLNVVKTSDREGETGNNFELELESKRLQIKEDDF